MFTTSIIHNRNFKIFLAYRFILTAATLMQSVVIGWHLYKLTNDVFILGLIGIAEVIPMVSITLFAGHYVDLWDRKKIILSTIVLLILGSFFLMIYTIPQLNLIKVFGIMPIFLAIILTGLSRGILMPAHNALLGQLVSRELYAQAATWNTTNWQIAAVTGSSMGGLIYGLFNAEFPAYFIIFIMYLTSFILISKISSPGMPLSLSKSSNNIFQSISEGIRFVFKNPILLGAFSLDMFGVLFGGAVAILPAFAKDVLNLGPQALGILRASPAIGAILMSAYLMINPPIKNMGKKLHLSLAGFGISIISFALSRNFLMTFIFLFLSGMFDSINVVIRQTILQVFTPDEMKGRVSAVNSIFIGSSNELGAFESGAAARIMGLIPSIIFGGSMTLFITLLMSLINKPLRKLSLWGKH